MSWNQWLGIVKEAEERTREAVEALEEGRLLVACPHDGTPLEGAELHCRFCGDSYGFRGFTSS